MCNCGKKRTGYMQQHSFADNSITAVVPVQNITTFNFQYTGKTALTVAGNMSGKRYRFSYTGDIQPVDARDAGSMMGIPVLKKIK
ncbi:MAG: hypothetical protein ABI921_08240 [Panacibacter sp.]